MDTPGSSSTGSFVKSFGLSLSLSVSYQSPFLFLPQLHVNCVRGEVIQCFSLRLCDAWPVSNTAVAAS